MNAAGRILALAIGSAIVLIPLVQSGGNLGATAAYLVDFMTLVIVYGVVTLGLNVQLGYAGISNFGVAGFFLLGAYVAALFTIPPPSNEYLTYIGGFGPTLDLVPALRTDQWLPFIVGAIAAASACAALAGALSLLTPRLRADYLSIATIGVAEGIRTIAIVNQGLVNGDRGLIGIPSPFDELVPGDVFPYVQLVLFALAAGVLYLATERALRSPWGRVLRALREDETATSAMGKNVLVFKMQAFCFGAALIGVGGALYAFYVGGLTPQVFEPLQGTFLFWVMLIVGGIGSSRGALLGAFLVWGLWVTTLQLASLPLPVEIQSRIPYLRYVVLGVFFIAMLLMRPAGLIPEKRRVSQWVERLAARGGAGAPADRQGTNLKEAE